MKKKIAVLGCGWSSHFIDNFLDGMRKAANDQNTDIYFFNYYNFTEFSGFLNYTGASVFNLIRYEEYAGVVILSDLIGNPRILEKERLKILKAGVPAICVNHRLTGLSCISIDNYSGFYDLIEHLIKDHGIRDFAYIGGRETSIDLAERYKAYRNALSNNNIPVDQKKVFTIERTDYHYAYNFMSEYLSSNPQLPKAFVCASDLVAFALLKIFDERGIKVPDDVKVIGYDDLSYAKGIFPSLTTVKSNAELCGAEAVKRILSGQTDIYNIKIKSSPIHRETCGCTLEDKSVQNLFNLHVMSELTKSSEFSSQIERIDEIFTEAADVFTLLTNLELLFSKSHHFEGHDFCIFLKSDWSSVLINSAENLPLNLSYGQNVQAIVSIQNNKKYMRELISTAQLLPSKMIVDGESNFYHILPIFNHSYVHGYYVAKNSTHLIESHLGYTWARSFGDSIERFRKRNMFKQMSQQFLRLSTRDALSGMLNRVGLDKLAKPFYAQNKKLGLTTVLFFVDINKMKHINDKFGHLHGDLAVKTIAAAVMEVVPKNWLSIRYGGDEFLVVGNSKNYNGEDYCTLITQRLEKKTSVMQLPYNLSASVGTISVPPNSEWTLEEAVEKVDEIMYQKKQEWHKVNDN